MEMDPTKPLEYLDPLIRRLLKGLHAENPNIKYDYNISFCSIGKIARWSTGGVLDIRPLKNPFFIDELFLFSSDERKAIEFRNQILADEEVYNKNIEITAGSLDNIVNYNKKIDISIITSANEKEYWSWCGKHNMIPNRQIMSLLNAGPIKEIAKQFNSDYEGHVLIVSNEVEPLCSVFAQNSDIDPRKISGLGHIDLVRLRRILQKREENKIGEEIGRLIQAGEQYNRRGTKLKIKGAYVVGNHSNPWVILKDLTINNDPRLAASYIKRNKDIQEELNRHAGIQYGLELYTEQETKIAIVESVLALMDEKTEVCNSILHRVSADYALYALQPTTYQNYFSIAKNHGNWINTLVEHDKEEFNRRTKSTEYMLEILTGRIGGSELENYIYDILRQSKGPDSRVSRGIVQKKARQLSDNFLRSINDEAPIEKVHIHFPDTEIKQREKPKPKEIIISDDDKNQEYAELGLEGILVAPVASTKQDLIGVYKLEDFSMMTSFDVNCIDKILLEGRYLVMLRKVKNKIDKYDYEIAVGNLRTGDMFSHSLQDASDVIGINLENQAIDIAYIDKKRNHWWVSFDIAQESEKCLYESNRINTEFPKGGSNAAFAKLENEVQLLIGGMGKITRINGQGQSLEALNGAESSLFNIKAYQNYVFASTIDDKVFMWDINKPAKPQSFESILGEYDVDKNLRLAILPDNKLEIKDLKGGQDVNYDYSFDLANDVHLFDNGILLIGETDSYFQPNDKRLSPTMMKIKKIYIEPQYLIKK